MWGDSESGDVGVEGEVVLGMDVVGGGRLEFAHYCAEVLAGDFGS